MSGATGVTPVRRARLSHDEVRAVLALADLAADVDGAAPFSEHVTLRIGAERDTSAVHLLVPGPAGQLAGYGHLDPGTSPPTAELVVHPLHRRRGLGRALVEAVTAQVTDPAGVPVPAAPDRPAARPRFWAHGDHPSAAALAVDLGFDRIRLLHQLRRSLRDPLPALRLPAGVSIHPFRPGADDQGWLAVNARAFREHPEQGRWTGDDLRVRLAQPWFDAAGFLLAVDDATGRLLGFHWTKVHNQVGSRHADALGEVYVLGVDPDAHGLGLGTTLTLAGLHHLRDRGLARVMLYVDGSNSTALRLYQRLGFAHWSTHVQYG